MNPMKPKCGLYSHLIGVIFTAILLAAIPAASRASAPAGFDTPVSAQQRALSTPQLIDQALANGEITVEQRDLYLAYAIYEYDSLPVRFRSDVGWSGTAIVAELTKAWTAAAGKPGAYSRATFNELDRLLSPAAGVVCDQTDGPNNDSTSANFYINYGTISGGLTLADYRSMLDAAFATEVTGYGWAKPPVCPAGLWTCPPPDNKYPVQIAALGGGLYGYVTTSIATDYAGWIVFDNPNTPELETDSTTSCMVLRNDSYVTLGGPAGLQVTAAHEFVHAIQNGYGDPALDEDLIWWEGHAAYAEDEVWDAVDDNYQYLWPDWTYCLGEWPTGAPNYPEYSSWILFRYAAERNGGANVAGGGEDVAQRLWANIAAGQSGLIAFNNALAAKTPGATLADTFHNYAIASRFMKSCPHSSPYCYEEAAGYVTAKGSAPANHGSVAAVGSSYSGTIRDNYAINWVSLPATGGPYLVTLSNTSAGGQLRGSLVADPTGNRTGTLDVKAFPTVVNTAGSRGLCYTPPTASNSVVAVITNQSRTADNPGSCTSRSYNIAVSAASSAGSLANLPVGATVDIGCGTYVKAKRNTGDPGTVTATKTAGAAALSAGIVAMPVTWGITASGATYNVDLTLCYTDAELTAAGATESDLRLFRSVDGTTWTDEGADTRDTVANCLTKNSVSAFSSWSLGSGTPTAVALTDLTARTGSGSPLSAAGRWLDQLRTRLGR